jgi:hypothetical protein
VREARAFVGRLLGPSRPCRDVAVLLASEMVTNHLLQGGSGSGPGEAITVTVVVSYASVRVEVTGRKANGNPVLSRPDDEVEGSRGLSGGAGRQVGQRTGRRSGDDLVRAAARINLHR